MNRSSTLLTCIGAAGVVLTAVLTAKATPKAMQILKEAETEKGEKLSKWEVVKEVAPAYIPAIVSGTLTIACIFSANVLNKRQQAALTSAYALLDNYHKEYSNKLKELYGEEANMQIQNAIYQDKYEEWKEECQDLSDGELLFYDYRSHEYFNATFDEVIEKTVMDDGMECYIISTPFDNDYLLNPFRPL